MIPVALVIIVALVAGWFVVLPLFRSPEPSDDSQTAQGEARSRRNVALDAILELEDDMSMGKLTQDDFIELKARYEADAVRASREELLTQAEEDALEAEIELAKRQL